MGLFAEVFAPASEAVKFQAVALTASSAKEISADDLGYYTFAADVDTWIIFGDSASVPDPDETEIDDSEDDLPWLLKAGIPQDFRIATATRFFKQKGVEVGTLRFYLSGA